MSWLFILNYFILQWLFIRLCKIIEDNTKQIKGYNIMIGVYPLSGWGEKKYKYFNKENKCKYLFKG